MEKDKKWIIKNRANSFTEEKMPFAKYAEQKQMQKMLVEFTEYIQDLISEG